MSKEEYLNLKTTTLGLCNVLNDNFELLFFYEGKQDKTFRRELRLAVKNLHRELQTSEYLYYRTAPNDHKAYLMNMANNLSLVIERSVDMVCRLSDKPEVKGDEFAMKLHALCLEYGVVDADKPIIQWEERK